MPQSSVADPLTILIVEDESFVRMHGVDLLEDAGFTVIEAADADEAVALLEKAHQVQILFTDVDMPGSMNGLELAEIVHQRWPSVRLLVTSGHHRLNNEDIPDSGRFMAKPYSAQTVIANVDRLMQDKEH